MGVEPTLIGGGDQDTDTEGRPREDAGGDRVWSPGGTSPAHTLVLYLQPPGLGENSLLLSGPRPVALCCGHWSFLMSFHLRRDPPGGTGRLVRVGAGSRQGRLTLRMCCHLPGSGSLAAGSGWSPGLPSLSDPPLPTHTCSSKAPGPGGQRVLISWPPDQTRKVSLTFLPK